MAAGFGKMRSPVEEDLGLDTTNGSIPGVCCRFGRHRSSLLLFEASDSAVNVRACLVELDDDEVAGRLDEKFTFFSSYWR